MLHRKQNRMKINEKQQQQQKCGIYYIFAAPIDVFILDHEYVIRREVANTQTKMQIEKLKILTFVWNAMYDGRLPI